MVTVLVLAESVALTLAGAGAGMLGALAAVEAAGPLVRQYLPVWNVPVEAWPQALGLGLGLGVLAGAVPAWNALRLPIVHALRQA
jgi:putative ABC transport system permease protein